MLWDNYWFWCWSGQLTQSFHNFPGMQFSLISQKTTWFMYFPSFGFHPENNPLREKYKRKNTKCQDVSAVSNPHQCSFWIFKLQIWQPNKGSGEVHSVKPAHVAEIKRENDWWISFHLPIAYTGKRKVFCHCKRQRWVIVHKHDELVWPLTYTGPSSMTLNFCHGSSTWELSAYTFSWWCKVKSCSTLYVVSPFGSTATRIA